MFGNVRAGHLHELPSRIDSLLSHTGTSFGDPASLVRRHSVFGSYLALLDESRVSAFLGAVAEGETLRGQMILGLRASDLGARHPLRYCGECAEGDRTVLGYARWLTELQLPGTWICTTHATSLIEIQVPSRPWQLPFDESSTAVATTTGVQACALHALAIAADVAKEIFISKHVDSTRLAQAALAQMVYLRIIGNPTRLNELELHDRFSRSLIGLFLASPGRAETALLHGQSWVVNLIRSRHATHPSKWAVLWAWLWEKDSRSDALAAFRRAVAGEFQDVGQLQSSLWSATIDAGIDISMRRVHDAMLASTNLGSVAVNAGISRGVLGRWMSEHASLRSLWSRRQFDIRRTRVTDALERAVRCGGFENRSEFVLQNCAAVRWLEVHDPTTISEFLQRIPLLRSSQRRLF